MAFFLEGLAQPRCKNDLFQVILGTTLDNIVPACYGQHATLILFLLFCCYEEKDSACYHVSLFLIFVFGLFGFFKLHFLIM